MEKMCWKTIVEVPKTLLDGATITLIVSRTRRGNKGSSWTPMHEGEKLEAARDFCDGGVSNQDDHRVKYRVESS